MRTRRSTALAAAVLVAMGAAACSGGHSSTNGNGGASAKTGTVKVPPVHDGDLRPVLAEWLRRNHAPGVVVGVQVGAGAPVFVVSGHTGDRAAARPSDTTPFAVGGVADALVGATVVELSEHGDLDLDATLAKWMPRFPNAGQITVRDLLTQRSGLASFVATKAQSGFTPAQVVAVMQKRPLLAKPGTVVHYSRVNSILLGLIAAAVTRTDLASAVNAQVLGPLGLRGTSFAPTGAVSTPGDLLAFSTGYLRAHVRGAHDLAASAFAIGSGGTGVGIDGVSSDGICAIRAEGCAPRTPFFAVGAAGSTPSGSAVVVYDPVYDVSVVVLASAGRFDVENLALRADLLTKVGKGAYDKTVGFTPKTTPTSAP